MFLKAVQKEGIGNVFESGLKEEDEYWNKEFELVRIYSEDSYVVMHKFKLYSITNVFGNYDLNEDRPTIEKDMGEDEFRIIQYMGKFRDHHTILEFLDDEIVEKIHKAIRKTFESLAIYKKHYKDVKILSLESVLNGNFDTVYVHTNMESAQLDDFSIISLSGLKVKGFQNNSKGLILEINGEELGDEITKSIEYPRTPKRYTGDCDWCDCKSHVVRGFKLCSKHLEAYENNEEIPHYVRGEEGEDIVARLRKDNYETETEEVKK